MRPLARPLLNLLALLATVTAASGGCFPDPDHSRADSAPDPERVETVRACGARCEDHFSAICASATDQSLCTCAPLGNSRNGRWDCRPNWIDTAPACIAGADHGTACPRVITGVEQACAVTGSRQVCYCGTGSTWRCAVFGQAP